MITRRFFASCAICVASGLKATAVDAQPAPGFTRTVLQQADGPAEGYNTLLVRVEIQPSAFIAWHTHPGIESAIIVAGGGLLSVKGLADREVKPGDSFQVPTAMPHALQNGGAPTTVASTYVVEKGKPLATLVAM